VPQQDSPEVTVEVRGEKLPNVNPEDEIKVEILVPIEQQGEITDHFTYGWEMLLHATILQVPFRTLHYRYYTWLSTTWT